MWKHKKRQHESPPIRPFISVPEFKTRFPDETPDGDFCWVAVTESGRFRLCLSWKLHNDEIRLEGAVVPVQEWLHASVGEYKEEIREMSKAAA